MPSADRERPRACAPCAGKPTTRRAESVSAHHRTARAGSRHPERCRFRRSCAPAHTHPCQQAHKRSHPRGCKREDLLPSSAHWPDLRSRRRRRRYGRGSAAEGRDRQTPRYPAHPACHVRHGTMRSDRGFCPRRRRCRAGKSTRLHHPHPPAACTRWRAGS